MNNQTSAINNVVREIFSRNGVQSSSDRFLVLAMLALAKGCTNRDSLDDVIKQIKLSPNARHVLVSHLAGVWNECVERLGSCETVELFDAALEGYRNLGAMDLRGMEFTSPECVNDMTAGLLSLDDGGSFIDICCGMGGMLVRAAIERQSPEVPCVGIEINEYAAAVAELRTAMEGVDGVAINPMGPLSNGSLNSGDMFAPKNYRRGKYDKVICVPPFGVRSCSPRPLVEQFLNLEHPLFPKCGGTLDWVFVARALSSMDDGGRAVVILPAGAMFSKTEHLARRYFVDRQVIEAVIALPERIFHGTSIRTCAVVLRKGSESIKMIDATKQFVEGRGYTREMSPENVRNVLSAFSGKGSDMSCVSPEVTMCNEVTHEDVASHGFDLDPCAYSSEPASFANDVRLDEIADIHRGTSLSVNRMREYLSEKATSVRFLSYSDIDDDGMVDVSTLPYLKGMPAGQEQFCAVDGDLVITRLGATCKSAVVNVPAGEKVICSTGLYVCSVDKTRVDAYYIKAFLESAIGSERTERIMRGNVQRAISIADFKALKIPLEPLEKQRQIGEHFRAAQDDIAVLKRKLLRARDTKGGVFGEYVKEA